MAWREQAAMGNLDVQNKLTYLNATFTIGAEAAEAITTAIQVTDYEGNDISWAVCLPFYISSDSAGQVPLGATDEAITAGTDGAVILAGAAGTAQENSGFIITEADGDMDLVITDAGADGDTRYINLVMPDGRIVTSGALTWAA